MIENILIVDTETTGLDPKNGSQVIEIAAILFNLKHKSILQCFSTLLPCETNPVEQINRISPSLTQCEYPFRVSALMADEYEAAWQDPANQVGSLIYEETISFNMILIQMAREAQCCVAHNAQFDKKFIATLPCGDALLGKRWICTRNDFRWPVHLSGKKLQDICKAMDVPYLNAHRALMDCLLLSQCFERVHDLDQRFNNI